LPNSTPATTKGVTPAAKFKLKENQNPISYSKHHSLSINTRTKQKTAKKI